MNFNPLWRALRCVVKPTLALLQDELRGLPLGTLRELHAWLGKYIRQRRIEL